jgi:hypothetical protein
MIEPKFSAAARGAILMTTFADIGALKPRFSGALLQPGDPG